MARTPDKEPGFWCEYRPPQNAVEALVQRPEAQINSITLSAAVFMDWRDRRKATGATHE